VARPVPASTVARTAETGAVGARVYALLSTVTEPAATSMVALPLVDTAARPAPIESKRPAWNPLLATTLTTPLDEMRASPSSDCA